VSNVNVADDRFSGKEAFLRVQVTRMMTGHTLSEGRKGGRKGGRTEGRKERREGQMEGGNHSIRMLLTRYGCESIQARACACSCIYVADRACMMMRECEHKEASLTMFSTLREGQGSQPPFLLTHTTQSGKEDLFFFAAQFHLHIIFSRSLSPTSPLPTSLPTSRSFLFLYLLILPHLSFISPPPPPPFFFYLPFIRLPSATTNSSRTLDNLHPFLDSTLNSAPAPR
jgi:hypothetical protein